MGSIGFRLDYSCCCLTSAHHSQIADTLVLNGMQRARGAGYEHMDRSGCLKGTRVALLNEVDEWAEDSAGPRIFWLNGLVGTGKSTIAQTVAERCFARGKLGASFFCSHHLTHDDPNIIFPTLAFQLAQKYTNVRSTLVHHLRLNPEIEYESLKSQAEKLITEPLQSADVATVIVIDGLDECKGENSSSMVLSVLESIVERAPKVKFFITSRPGPLIECGFSRPNNIVNISTLHDIAPCLINNDIRLFLEHQLSRLAAREGLGNWPTAAQLDLLRDRAGGLFAYAVATVKFLDHWSLGRRYAAINRDPSNTSHEGKVEGVHRKSSLDSLCTSIFQVSFGNNTAEEDDIVRLVLDAALFTLPCLPSAIPGTVRQQTGEVVEMKEVTGILKSISPLLELHENDDRPVRPFHKLLSDCLIDQKRCPKRFLICRNHANVGL